MQIGPDRDAFFTTWRCRAIFLVLAIAFPIIVYGAIGALRTNTNRVQDWLPEQFEETQDLRWFTSRFGSGEILVLSWQGCTIDDPRVSLLAERLQEARHPESGERLFRAVHSGPAMIRRLQQPPLRLTQAEAVRRTQGWLVGPDGETTALLALVSTAGADDRHAVVDTVYREARESAQLEPDELFVGGSTVDGVAIDRTAEAGMVWLNLGAFGLSVALIFLCFRSWRIAILIFVTAVFAELLSLSNLYFTGVNMDSVSLLMASVVYVLSISASVHLINYYRETLLRDGLRGAPERAVRHALTPCFLATFTTVIGLGSLAGSQIVPIAKFGVYSAVAMVLAFGVVFLLVPATLKQFPVGHEAFLRGGRPETSTTRWSPLHQMLRRACYVVLLGTLVALVVGGIGLTRLKTTVRLHDMFPDSAKIIRDYNWLERHVGPLVPIEIVIRIPLRTDQPLLERMQVVEEATDRVARIDGVGAVVNAATFLPHIPDRTAGGAGSAIRRTLLRHYIEQARDELQATGYLLEENGHELWRISVRVAAHEYLDYAELLDQLHAMVEPVLHDAEQRGSEPLSAVYSGGIPLVHKAQTQLLQDLITSFLTAFVLVALCLITVFSVWFARRDGLRLGLLWRGPAAGALAMVPNLLPMILIFGAMGWMGRAIEMGIMMTASVALGVAVDDTLHFVTWFVRGLRDGKTREAAVLFAFHRCGTAMIQTSMICGLGLMVFALSPFVPISSFSYLMFVLLAAAVLGDLLVLPALLISPLGAVFQPPSAGGPRVGRERLSSDRRP